MNNDKNMNIDKNKEIEKFGLELEEFKRAFRYLILENDSLKLENLKLRELVRGELKKFAKKRISDLNIEKLLKFL